MEYQKIKRAVQNSSHSRKLFFINCLTTDILCDAGDHFHIALPRRLKIAIQRGIRGV
jgi:hypothetical protein